MAKKKVLARAGNRVIRSALARLPKSLSLALQYYRYHGRWPNLSAPRSFTEKIQYRKLHDHDPRLALCSDKLVVKDYVAERVGAEAVTPTLWSGKALPPRDERRWQIPYVIKCNHGSGANLFIRSPADEDWPGIEAETRRWMKQRYKPHLREHHYDAIEPHILVEPFIGGETPPTDYKFYLFNGVTALVLVYLDRGSDLRVQVLDRDWNPLPCRFYRDPPDQVPAKPVCFERMRDMAEKLGAEFSFVRADFYEIDGKPRFGELTFTPSSGFRPFSPSDMDAQYGDLWCVEALRPIGRRRLMPRLRPALQA